MTTRNFLSTLLLCMAILHPLAPGISAAEPAPESGFVPLFNGKNLDGWQTARTKESEPLEGKTEAHKGRFKVVDGNLVIDPSVKGDLYISTTREFAKDMHLKFEFNGGEKCNNDHFLRGTKFDIVPGGKETKAVKEGAWHKMEIIVQGDKVEHKLDGETVRSSTAKAATSPFMLRAEFGTIQYRNIRFKE